MSMTETQSIIDDCPWLKDVPATELQALAQQARIIHYDAGDYLYFAGSPRLHVGTVLSGLVRVVLACHNGQEVFLGYIENQTWIGAGMPTNSYSQVSYQVVEAAEALVLPRAAILDTADRFPSVYRNLLTSADELLDNTVNAIELFVFYSLRERLAYCLLELAKALGRPSRSGTRIERRLSQQEIATLVGGSRPKVNQHLKQFETDNILTREDGFYTVTDMKALLALAPPIG